MEKKLDGNNTKMLQATPYKTMAEQPLTSHLINYPNKTNKTCWIVVFYGISYYGYLMPNPIYTYMVHSIGFQSFFAQSFKIVIDS